MGGCRQFGGSRRGCGAGGGYGGCGGGGLVLKAVVEGDEVWPHPAVDEGDGGGVVVARVVLVLRGVRGHRCDRLLVRERRQTAAAVLAAAASAASAASATTSAAASASIATSAAAPITTAAAAARAAEALQRRPARLGLLEPPDLVDNQRLGGERTERVERRARPRLRHEPPVCWERGHVFGPLGLTQLTGRGWPKEPGA